ncbi:MAG: DinB family protein [Acidobacteriota bacterium]
MSMCAALLHEIEREFAATRRMLASVPHDKLDFKPHEKSMSLGRLCGHCAEIVDWGSHIVKHDEIDFAAPEMGERGPGVATDIDGLLADQDRHTAAFAEALGGIDDAKLGDTYTMKRGDEVIMAMPKGIALRSMVVNHIIHHRGQLSVYLRLLDVPLPQVYGPTADNPNFWSGDA